MFYLNEYRRRSARLADHLPWGALIGPGLVLNKDASLQKTLAFRGPDLALSTRRASMAARARLSDALKRLPTGWTLHIEARRSRALEYPQSPFPDPITRAIDAERREQFRSAGRAFETVHRVTLSCPIRVLRREAASPRASSPPSAALGSDGAVEAAFREVVNEILDLLRAFMPEAEELGDTETLSYLHSCISSGAHDVAWPDGASLFLDALLADEDLRCGLDPMLGRRHLAVVSVRSYPSSTFPGLLSDLDALGVPYRWVSRFLPLGKEDARRALTAIRRRWFSQRKGISGLLKEAITREPLLLEDPDARAKAQDADAALAILGGDLCGLGYYTPTITLAHEDASTLAGMARAVEAVLSRAGLVAKREDVNAVEAWLGSLPGHAHADRRRPLVSTLSLADLLPLSATWPGPKLNAHMSGWAARRQEPASQPPLMHVRTDGFTPFRLDLHHGDVGHTLVVGPTGSGKSVFLNFAALQWLRYPQARVVVFDKGASARAATLLAGGRHYALRADGEELAFQPLAAIDAPDRRARAAEWITLLLEGAGVGVSPERRGEIWSTLAVLAEGPADRRTLTHFGAAVQDRLIKAAVEPFTLDGPYGALLDADQGEPVLEARWVTFEMGELMAGPRMVCALTLRHLLDSIEDRLDGAPTLIVLDEAWLFLEHELFAPKIREWLKVLRKRNAAVLFATQSLSDVADTPLAASVLEGCPTRIFLPNPEAESDLTRARYRDFGLNDQEIARLARAEPKRHYLYKSPAGARLFELALGPTALLAAGSSSREDHVLMDQLLAEGADDFPERFLAARRLATSSGEVQP